MLLFCRYVLEVFIGLYRFLFSNPYLIELVCVFESLTLDDLFVILGYKDKQLKSESCNSSGLSVVRFLRLANEVEFKELKDTGLNWEIDLLVNVFQVFFNSFELEFKVKFTNLLTPLLSNSDSKEERFAFKDIKLCCLNVP